MPPLIADRISLVAADPLRRGLQWAEGRLLCTSVEMVSIAFVVGTGRSGTHWLGWTLDEHPGVRATIEEPTIFRLATEAAVNASKAKWNLRALDLLYAREQFRSRPALYVDKSHPNLWHVEHLARRFPSSVFIAMRRGVLPTVASMMKHDGVLRWQSRWRDFPVPNPFLGITVSVAAYYDDLSRAAQCALRWKAHSDRIDELAASMPADRFLVVEYEDLAVDYQAQAQRIWSFLDLPAVPLSIDVNTASLDKWRAQLSEVDIADVRRIVNP